MGQPVYMRYVLDTNVFIWLNDDPSKVSQAVYRIAADPSHIKFVSIVSIWEMQIKLQLGKLALKSTLTEMLAAQAQFSQFQIMPLEVDHILTLSRLSLGNHRDPFVRLIVAQAIYEQMPLISYDSQLDQYPVQIIR